MDFPWRLLNQYRIVGEADVEVVVREVVGGEVGNCWLVFMEGLD